MHSRQSRERRRPFKFFLSVLTTGVSLQLYILLATLSGLSQAQDLPSPTPRTDLLRMLRDDLRGDNSPTQSPLAASEDLEAKLKNLTNGEENDDPLNTILGLPMRMQGPAPQDDDNGWYDNLETQVVEEVSTLEDEVFEQGEPVEGKEDDEDAAPGKPLFIPHADPSGLSISSVVHAADLTLLGEEEKFNAAAFKVTASCGDLFLNSKVEHYAPNKTCVWNYWAQRLHAMHPELTSAAHPPGRKSLGFGWLSLGLASKFPLVSRALTVANNPLSSLCWIVAKNATRELRKQQERGEEANIGSAITSVFRENKELAEPMQTAFYLVSGKGCNADVPYTDRAREGFQGFFPSLKKCPMNPLLQHYANHPEETLAWVPPALPKRFSVTVAVELPPEQQNDEWRLPLYRLWHLLWFQIFEGYRLDHLWGWLRDLDTRHFFPGWEVKTVGVALLTERRPVTYANGFWRFANIHPHTLELAKNPDGSYKDPFELLASGRPHPAQQLKEKREELSRKDKRLLGTGGAFLGPLLLKAKRFGSSKLKGKGSSSTDTKGSSSTDTEDSSSEEETCYDTQVIAAEKYVRYLSCGKELRIHKSICGAVPTFDYISQSPFAVLLSPLKETREHADTLEPQQQPSDGGLSVGETETDAGSQEETADGQNKRDTRQRTPREEAQALKAMGWTVADAVWVFRPSTSTKVWLINRMVAPLENEPLLSTDPEAKMSAGHRLFFRLSLRPLLDKFIDTLQSAATNSTNSSSSSSSSSDYSDIAERFAQRSETRPFTIIFSGLSIGGATSEIAAIYFASEMRRRGLDNAVRIACIAFGAPSWGTPAMYASFDRLGIIWNEIVSAHDPVPELLAGEDILGLAHDRRQIVLRTEDFGSVAFTSPFLFEGSAWLKGTAQAKLWQQVVVWLFGVKEIFALPHNPHVAHQHIYSAALSLMSGAYKFAGWASHLAVPWLRNIQITTVPDAMDVLKKAHARRFEGTPV